MPLACKDDGATARSRTTMLKDMHWEAWKAASKAENELQKLQSQANRARLFAASDMWLAGLPSVESDAPKGEEAGAAPAWISQVDASHPQLFYGAGLVYCNYCSCVASSARGNSRLWQECRKVTPEGSMGRRKRLKEGKHPHSLNYKVEQWPDGRHSSQRVQFRQYKSVQQASCDISPQFQLLQQRDYTEPDILDAVPSASEAQAVAEILDALLGNYEGDPEAEVPSFQDIFRCGPVARVSGAVCKWLAAARWTQAIEDLLERSFPFESALADAISGAKKNLQIARELHPLDHAREDDLSD